MKVVVVLWDFFGGGAERVAVVLAGALLRLGCDVCIVVAHDEGPNRALVDPGIAVVRPEGPGALRFLGHLRRVLRRERPDVVLAHQTTRNVMAILAHLSVAGRRRRIVVGVEHGEMRSTVWHRRGLGLKAYFQLARLVYPFATAIVAVSDNIRRSVRAYLGPLPVVTRTLPNPVIFPGMLERSRKPPLHMFLREATTPVLLAVGRLEPQKNYPLMLEAFALLVKDTRVRLIIYGEGSLRVDLQARCAALGLDTLVDMPGYIDNPFAEMRAASALILSSVWEGLPTVAIEALACGTQVVSTDNSEGIRAILKHGALGWITPPDDALALCQAMRDAVTMPLDRTLLQASVGRYEAEEVARLYLSYFRQLGATAD